MMACALLCALGLTGLAAPAFAQSANGIANANINSSIAVVEPLTIVKTLDMDFGKIIGSNAGQIVLDPQATPTCTATAGLVRTDQCQPATFAGFGTTNRFINVRIPPGRAINLTGPGQNMVLNNMLVSGNPDLQFLLRFGRNNFFRISSPNGLFEFRVGGSLNVNANQAPGTYTGTFQVSVNYF